MLKKIGLKKGELFEQILYVEGGCFMFSIGVNMIIGPRGIYSGGSTGVIQLIRRFFLNVLNVQMPAGIDIAGIINLCLNIPILYMAYKVMGKLFFVKTMATVVMLSVFLALVPVLEEPIITDYLATCLIGGIMAGTGAGWILRGRSCGGGTDVIGVCCTKLFPGFSVGRMSIMINAVIFAIYLILFDVEIVIYSYIYVVICGLSLDRAHIQNINTSAMIFTKKEGLDEAIMSKMKRGVTEWNGTGAYTQEDSKVLYVVLSKFEVGELKRLIHSIDPDAFVVFNEGCAIDGNFEKRL